MVHYPMIRIVPLYPQIDFTGITHMIATSQTVLELVQPPPHVQVLAVGKKTGSLAKDPIIAKEECAEGIVELLKPLKDPYILYPHSSLSRPVISDFLKGRFRYREVILYDVELQAPDPRPQLSEFDKIVFTSPSQVEAFYRFFGSIPSHLIVECIGPITLNRL